MLQQLRDENFLIGMGPKTFVSYIVPRVRSLKLASSKVNVTSSPPHNPNPTALYVTIGYFAAEAISGAIMVCAARVLQLTVI